MELYEPNSSLKWPQCYPVSERMEYIEGFIKEGKSFAQIGKIMGDVGEAAIQYHWKRYKLGIYKKPKQKPKFTKEQEKHMALFARRILRKQLNDVDKKTIYYFFKAKKWHDYLKQKR